MEMNWFTYKQETVTDQPLVILAAAPELAAAAIAQSPFYMINITAAAAPSLAYFMEDNYGRQLKINP